MSVEKCNPNQVKEGQVNQELNDAENAANRLEARIGELEKRLSGVLHPSEAAVPCDVKEAEGTLVPLASRIRDHHKLLQVLGTHVGDMLDRLEIR